MQSHPAHLFVLVPTLALAACARDARAEVPKPPAGGHVFDVELVESEEGNAGATKTHHALAISGDEGCAKVDTVSGHNQITISACLRREPEGKISVSIDVSRRRSDARVRIEGRVPLAVGARALVGRTDDANRKLDVYVTAS